MCALPMCVFCVVTKRNDCAFRPRRLIYSVLRYIVAHVIYGSILVSFGMGGYECHEILFIGRALWQLS